MQTGETVGEFGGDLRVTKSLFDADAVVGEDLDDLLNYGIGLESDEDFGHDYLVQRWGGRGELEESKGQGSKEEGRMEDVAPLSTVSNTGGWNVGGSVSKVAK